jgi:serine protease AprX
VTPTAAAISYPASTLLLSACLALQCFAQGPDTTQAPQSRPVWVMLHPKPDNISLEDTRLTPRALDRRALRRTAPGLVDHRDGLILEHYITSIAALAPVRTVSNWHNAVSVMATPAQERQLESLTFVSSLRPVARGKRALPDGCTNTRCPEEPQTPYSARDFYGRASEQLTQLNLPTLHNAGLTGAGVIIAVLDTGFSRTHISLSDPTSPLDVLAERDFIYNDGVTAIEANDDPTQHEHGTLILSCLASYQPNELVGAAYDATYILCKTEDVRSETPIEEDYYAAAIEYSESLGADVTTSSLGYIDWYTQADLDGATAITTLSLNIAAENGVHACTAAGNAGHDDNPLTSTLGAPADALHVLTCGSVNFAGLSSTFTSSGPTADGRVKPELLARGRNTHCVDPNSATAFITASGTSLSTPLLAGVVACLTQAHPEWSVAQMREALMSTASDYAATNTFDPLYIRGYGIVNAAAALDYFCPADFNKDGGVDGSDIESFFSAWQLATANSDVNADGGIDGGDVETFFIAWTAGGC